MLPDIINGSFEFAGAVAILNHCRLLHRAQRVVGVSIVSTAFFAAWGLWNLFYYPNLSQWFSFAGGVAIVSANVLWVWLLWYYSPAKCYARMVKAIEALVRLNSNN